MDSFTQRMIEKAEQRNRALGLNNAPLNIPTTSATTTTTATAMVTKSPQRHSRSPTKMKGNGSSSGSVMNKLQVVEKSAPIEMGNSSKAANKVLRQFSAVDKENMDLGIEINIVSSKELEVQVEVEEQDITDSENDEAVNANAPNTNIINQPLARIRETSRNRLQRLGALYSNTDDLSSPIHRTEGQFHADTLDDVNSEANARKPRQKYGKLAALASSINQWEDDTNVHHGQTRNLTPPPKPDLPSRKHSTTNTQSTQSNQANNADRIAKTKGTSAGGGDSTGAKIPTTKKLNWDPKVMDSLEAQGFQRRESSTVKLAYEYGKQPKELCRESKETDTATTTNHSKILKNPSNMPIRTGLVSGRAAAFEQKASNSQQQSQLAHKDPTELSLKERMQLFERNKGEALIPKSALGMAPSINQIRQDHAKSKSEETKAHSNAAIAGAVTSVKMTADSKVRDKVAALVANTTTISENKIRADIQKQRAEDMQVLANRFHKQRDIFNEGGNREQEVAGTTAETAKATQHSAKVQRAGMPPPPPPPPLPSSSKTATQTNSPSCTKRRSPGDAIDDDDESKRARKTPKQSSTNRLYPALSDLESNSSQSDIDNCATTTATVSPINSRRIETSPSRALDEGNEYDEENDSYMGSEMAAEDCEDDDANDGGDDDDDDDSSADFCNGSLGRDVFKTVVQKNDIQLHHQHDAHKQQKQRKEVRYAERNHYIEHCNDSSINSSEGSMCVDDCIDEALDGDLHCSHSDDFDESGDAGNSSRVSRGSHGTAASNSFSFRKTPHKVSTYRTISEEPNADDDDKFEQTVTANGSTNASEPPIRSNLTVNKDDDNMVTLVHTVSFYRRQQSANSANNTPVRKICREEQVTRSALSSGAASGSIQYDYEGGNSDYRKQQQQQQEEQSFQDSHSHEDEDSADNENDEMSEHLVQEKIKKLLDEVCKQQQIIAQTSQALNLCAATVEFSGSTESVEGERHLLVATHRRQACLDEVQRLRVEKSLRPHGAPKERGRLTVKEITVPLRQDYIRKLAADTISGHHLVCLLKYNEHVLATKTVPTLPGLLAVKFPDVLQLNNVFADFKVTLEIYGMTAQREVLPHEVKYHINLNKKSGIKTPKKKGNDNILVMPPVQSPAGPHVVRTPALVQYGFAIFSLREIQRTTWSLTQILGVCPLAGVVHMKVQCELSVSVENKGFLTMYEDISGLGAWHRRWCHLNGSVLNYWKYPDDERKKTPIGSIDLYSCISSKVALAPRDICARLHTILLECQRPAKETDRESLIIVPNGDVTIVRYLLSADTKDEREEWCACFNKSLALLRAWGPPN